MTIFLQDGWVREPAGCPHCSRTEVCRSASAWDTERGTFLNGWALKGSGYEADDVSIVFCPFCGGKLP